MARAVCVLLTEAIAAARADRLDDEAVWIGLRNLGRIGREEAPLFEFLRRHPESALLISRAADPIALAHVLEGEDYPELVSIYNRLIDPRDADALTAALGDSRSREQLARLESERLHGMEALFLCDGRQPGAKEYLDWVHEAVGDALQAPDDRRGRLLAFALQERTALLERCRYDADFARRLADPLWGRLREVAQDRPEIFTWLADHPRAWDVLRLEGQNGEVILRRWGLIGVDLLFGPLAYHRDVHPVVIQALTQQEKWPIVAALWKLREDHTNMASRPLDNLLVRRVDDELLPAMLGDLLANAPAARPDRIAYFRSLTDEKLREDLRDKAGRNREHPLLAPLIIAIGGPQAYLAYTALQIGQKRWDGREIPSEDWLKLMLAAGAVAEDYYRQDAQNRDQGSAKEERKADEHARPSEPAARELKIGDNLFVKVEGEAARGMQFNELLAGNLGASAVTFGREFMHRAKLRITGPLCLSLRTSGVAQATLAATEKQGVRFALAGALKSTLFVEIDPAFVRDALDGCLNRTAARLVAGEAEPEPTHADGAHDHEDAWRRNVSTWWYRNLVKH